MKLYELLFEETIESLPVPQRLLEYSQILRNGFFKRRGMEVFKHQIYEHHYLDDIDTLVPQLKRYTDYYRNLYHESKKLYKNLVSDTTNNIRDFFGLSYKYDSDKLSKRRSEIRGEADAKREEFANALEAAAIEIIRSYSHGRF
jgi:hypothetical protein